MSVGATSKQASGSRLGSRPESAPESGLLDSEPAELPAGSELGNYVIQACIGRGAMASVYRAEHSLLNKQVALKVMAPALHASLEARQRFLREARAVAAIQHPNVVSISDAGLFEGTPYLVMELLDGEDLEQHLLRHGPFAASELVAIALPIVAALAAAHDAGVIHRDLKPGNIFLARGSGAEVVPKLLDFGISKFASPHGPANLAVTAFDQLMGSPLYLPPEALQGSRELTARSDQYSLGVVLYECITGQAPFYRDDLVPLLNAICEGSCPAPHQLRPETPAALEQVILRAMRVDPQQRFAHIRELGQALLELADPHTRHRWSSAFAPPGEPALAPAAPAVASPTLTASAMTRSAMTRSAMTRSAMVVAPLEPSRLTASRATIVPGKRLRLLGACALLASGCVLMGLALGRVRSTSAQSYGASFAHLDALGTISHHERGHETSGAVLSLAQPLTALPAPGSPPRPPLGGTQLGGTPLGGAQRAPAPVVAVVPAEAEPLAAAASAPSSAAAAPAPPQKRRPAAKRAAEAEGARELSQLFFPETAAERAPATRERAAQKTAPAPVPLLVNEAPLFD